MSDVALAVEKLSAVLAASRTWAAGAALAWSMTVSKAVMQRPHGVSTRCLPRPGQRATVDDLSTGLRQALVFLNGGLNVPLRNWA